MVALSLGRIVVSPHTPQSGAREVRNRLPLVSTFRPAKPLPSASLTSRTAAAEPPADPRAVPRSARALSS